jgi:GNAT superfamily N-acetyltransferase
VHAVGLSLEQSGSPVAFPSAMPDSKVSVREASEADLAWCLSTDGHLDEAALLSKIRAREILVADSDGEPVGLLRFDLMWSSVPFIAQIRVLETYRRQGVGQALLQEVEERARACGSIAVLSSIALGSERTAALSWHEAMGFERFGDVDRMFPGEQTEAFLVKLLER